MRVCGGTWQHAMGLTPYNKSHPLNLNKSIQGTLIAGSVGVAIAVFLPFTVLEDMISAGVLIAFNMTNTGLMLHRRQHPTRPSLPRWLALWFNVLALLAAFLWCVPRPPAASPPSSSESLPRTSHTHGRPPTETTTPTPTNTHTGSSSPPPKAPAAAQTTATWGAAATASCPSKSWHPSPRSSRSPSWRKPARTPTPAAAAAPPRSGPRSCHGSRAWARHSTGSCSRSSPGRGSGWSGVTCWRRCSSTSCMGIATPSAPRRGTRVGFGG